MPPKAVRSTAQIFAVLRDRELRALWMADWISDTGSFITFIALAVYIRDLTGTVTGVGLALAIRSLPWFTLGPFAGVVADRLDRRTVVIWSNLIRAVLVGLLPFTHVAWQAYVISFGSAVFGPIHSPARSALRAQVAPEGKLVAALAVSETSHQVLHTVGPAIGGLSVLLLGARNSFFLDAASFVVAAAFQATVASRGKPPARPMTPVKDMNEGLLALIRNGAVRTYLLLSAALAFGYGGVIALLLFYVKDGLGLPEGLYGVVLSAAGVGTVITSLIIAARDRDHPRTMWPLLSVAASAPFALIWFRPALFPLLVIALASGLSDAGSGLPMAATIAEAMPADLLGRAYSAESATWEFAEAVGSLGFAWLAEPSRLGVVHGITLAALASAVLAVVVLAAGGAKAIAGYERRRMASVQAER
jgi:predicted MFS family arabinose efflux permease